VFDTIYNPRVTKLLTAAKAAGCHTISGMDMFYLQGAAQFEMWTGKPAPVDAFRKALES
jgi:shikimate dehydrogenase